MVFFDGEGFFVKEFCQSGRQGCGLHGAGVGGRAADMPVSSRSAAVGFVLRISAACYCRPLWRNHLDID